MAVGGLVGGAVSGGTHVAMNVAGGRPWHEGLGQAIAIGVTTGAVDGFTDYYGDMLVDTYIGQRTPGGAGDEGDGILRAGKPDHDPLDISPEDARYFIDPESIKPPDPEQLGLPSRAEAQALIDDVVGNELKNVRLTHDPEYDPYLGLRGRMGEAGRHTDNLIGPGAIRRGRAETLDTIVHEEMHHRIWDTDTRRAEWLQRRGISQEEWADRVAERFTRMKVDWSQSSELGYEGPSEGYLNRYRETESGLERVQAGETLEQMKVRRGYETDFGYERLPMDLMWEPGSRRSQHIAQLLDEHGELVRYQYVIDREGHIRLGQGRYHSHLAQGENVYGAGEIYYNRQCDIVRVDSKTGHYHSDYHQGKAFGEQFSGYLRNLLVYRYGYKNLPDTVFRMRHGQ